jgi:integrase
MAARELPFMSLMNSLALVVLYARTGSAKFEAAAVRWLARLALEGRDVRLAEHDLRHRRISLEHLRGVPWARIGELVGQQNIAVTANTYTHVLADEKELGYAELLV